MLRVSIAADELSKFRDELSKFREVIGGDSEEDAELGEGVMNPAAGDCCGCCC